VVLDTVNATHRQVQEDSLKTVVGLTKMAECPCMRSLQLWGSNQEIFGTPGDGNGQCRTCGTGSGFLGQLSSSPNYPIFTPTNTPRPFPILSERTRNLFLAGGVKVTEGRSPLLIGLLDSGFNPAQFSPNASTSLWQNPGETANLPSNTPTDHDGNGLPNDVSGWDFTNLGLISAGQIGSPNYANDETGHGSTVASFLMRELQNAPGAYRLMPLKILSNNDNRGGLFSALCAMEYARQKGVNVLNASFGYYGFRNSALEVILARLQTSNVLLVAAAGNDTNDQTACETNGKSADPAILRNLTTRYLKFFPASYSASLPVSPQNPSPEDTFPFSQNVIAVTSLYADDGTTIACPDQNFSNHYVDVGVLTDWHVGMPPELKTSFWVPQPPNSPPPPTPVKGSSYATPVMTGKVALAKLTNRDLVLKKIPVFTWLGTNPTNPRHYVFTSPTASSLVVGGKVTTHN
jgi:hypothetical protein